MASLLLKGVHKRLGLPSISISCSSADATNIIASTGSVAGVGSSSGRAIDRHSPRLRDPHRTSTSTSKPPRPSTSTKDSPSSDSSKTKRQHGHGNKKKKSTTAAAGTSEKRLVSPATSSRFLLNSSRLQSDDLDVLALPPPPPPSFIDVFPGGEGKPASFIDALPRDASLALSFAKEAQSPAQQAQSSSSSSSASSSSEITAVKEEEQQEKAAVLARSSSTTAARTTQVVVVLRVSLHCKGCAGKVKKHIAKMEGVTSIDIDIASKKVTVVGDVTPLGVLTSVSKVKPAQFWPSQPCPPRASASF
uniref:Predicted protein n=1 Tax=Hordeum vulgare subsp. vulgare TaxID=112509 RepID=F2DC24_HORVV|nr:predicted protein [Hordeum vulgare subsp. vulgare]